MLYDGHGTGWVELARTGHRDRNGIRNVNCAYVYICRFFKAASGNECDISTPSQQTYKHYVLFNNWIFIKPASFSVASPQIPGLAHSPHTPPNPVRHNRSAIMIYLAACKIMTSDVAPQKSLGDRNYMHIWPASVGNIPCSWEPEEADASIFRFTLHHPIYVLSSELIFMPKWRKLH